jgi:uncharacterized protein YbgA (DUF1722 family)/uncharacterized protein YbbK (DUF523 family)
MDDIFSPNFERPNLVSSKCIEFAPCRYNGLMIKSKLVDKLKEYADFIPICPEMGIGLGVPRDPVRVVDTGDGLELFQPATGKKLADKMENFSETFFKSLKDVDGFIFKNKSPSCGVKAINVYTSFGNARPRKDGVGLFAAQVMKKYPNLPVEDEGRLRNLFIREDFLTKIFTIADFRRVKSEGFNDILNFHTRNKLLFMSYSPLNVKKLGQIVSDKHEEPLDIIKEEYEAKLLETLHKTPNIGSNINVLAHVLGYFSKELKHDEKQLFLNTVDDYRDGKIPLLVCLNMLKQWNIRFSQEYLLKQTFFEPYPHDLMQITFI